MLETSERRDGAHIGFSESINGYHLELNRPEHMALYWKKVWKTTVKRQHYLDEKPFQRPA